MSARLAFPGSQAAIWFGHIVEVMGPAWKTGIVCVAGPDIDGKVYRAGWVCTGRVKPIGPVARELLKMRL